MEMLQEAYGRCSLTLPPTRICGGETTLRKVLHMIVDAYPLNKTWGTIPGTEIKFYVPMFNGVVFSLDETQPHGRLLFTNDQEPDNEQAKCILDITVEREYAGREVTVEEQAPPDYAK